MSWLGSPNIRPKELMNCCRGIGSRSRRRKVTSLIMAAITAVFTISYVANLLGEDADWLHELSIDMFPEDGRL